MRSEREDGSPSCRTLKALLLSPRGIELRSCRNWLTVLRHLFGCSAEDEDEGRQGWQQGDQSGSHYCNWGRGWWLLGQGGAVVHRDLFSVVLNMLCGLRNAASMHSFGNNSPATPAMWLSVSLSPPIKGHGVGDGTQSLGGTVSWAVLLMHFLELSKRDLLYIYQVSPNELISAILSVIVCCSKDYVLCPFTFLGSGKLNVFEIMRFFSA